MNALRHGLTAQTVVLPTEDLEAYQRHLKSFADEYRPKGASECNLLQALADATWRLNRIPTLETNLLSVAPDDTLTGTALLAFLERQAKAVAVFGIHSQRLSRQIEKTAAELRALQETRLWTETWDMEKLLFITEMYEARGETYDPSEDGFVFTKAQISHARMLRTRELQFNEALEDADPDKDKYKTLYIPVEPAKIGDCLLCPKAPRSPRENDPLRRRVDRAGCPQFSPFPHSPVFSYPPSKTAEPAKNWGLPTLSQGALIAPRKRTPLRRRVDRAGCPQFFAPSTQPGVFIPTPENSRARENWEVVFLLALRRLRAGGRTGPAPPVETEKLGQEKRRL